MTRVRLPSILSALASLGTPVDRRAPSRATFAFVALTAIAFGALGCSDSTRAPEPETTAAPATFEWPEGPRTHAILEIEGVGEIHVALYPELAPENAALFEKLTGLDYYDGTTFHRVVPGFMIQGGDPNTRDPNPKNDGTGSSGMTVPDEFSQAPFDRGVVAMANRGHPNTGSGQYFIVQQDSHALNGRYSVFGRVVRGMEIVDAIATSQRDEGGRWGPKDRPLENIVVREVRLRASEQDPAAGLARNP